jgi:hypothetical protein
MSLSIGTNNAALRAAEAASISTRKDVCIMAFLGLHDLSRRIFQSAAI